MTSPRPDADTSATGSGARPEPTVRGDDSASRDASARDAPSAADRNLLTSALRLQAQMREVTKYLDVAEAAYIAHETKDNVRGAFAGGVVTTVRAIRKIIAAASPAERSMHPRETPETRPDVEGLVKTWEQALERLAVYTAMEDAQLAMNCERIIRAALSAYEGRLQEAGAAAESWEEQCCIFERRWEAAEARASAAKKERDALLPVYDAAHGLSFGEDWNGGTAAKTHGYRRKLLLALGRAAKALGHDASHQALTALEQKPEGEG